jgi:hypothetical protein
MGTKIFGQEGYKDSQLEHCVCVPSTNILSHYVNAIENYYSKYVPDKVINVKEVVEKSKYAANTGSEDKPIYKGIYKFYYALLKKYDNGITHIDDRIGKKIATPKTDL